MLGPVDNTKDISENTQLQSRDFWVSVEHPELGSTLSYPGPFIKQSEDKIRYRCRAPLIGEHNIEVYHNELGLPKEELILLKQAMVI